VSAWGRDEPNDAWFRFCDDGPVLTVARFKYGWAWAAAHDGRSTGGEAETAPLAMQAADQFVYAQGYRPERSEGER
jgi:hypothetical protein